MYYAKSSFDWCQNCAFIQAYQPLVQIYPPKCLYRICNVHAANKHLFNYIVSLKIFRAPSFIVRAKFKRIRYPISDINIYIKEMLAEHSETDTGLPFKFGAHYRGFQGVFDGKISEFFEDFKCHRVKFCNVFLIPCPQGTFTLVENLEIKA